MAHPHSRKKSTTVLILDLFKLHSFHNFVVYILFTASDQ